jgi:hypothetical protein
MICNFLQVSSSDQICEEVGGGPNKALQGNYQSDRELAKREKRTIILVIAMNARMKTM